MLHTLKNLKGAVIKDLAGENIGNIKDYYFDDSRWVIRYLVVNTGSWLSEKLVLISPYAIKKIGWGSFNIETNITKEQIERSPSAESEKTVSRSFEEKYSRYYGWPLYWTWGAGIWPNNIYPHEFMHLRTAQVIEEQEKHLGKPDEEIHLRSYNEVVGYKIEASDELFGHVDDFLIEEETYQIKYFAVDTINFWPSQEVLLSPLYVDDISWPEKTFQTKLSKMEIEGLPEFDIQKMIQNKTLGGEHLIP